MNRADHVLAASLVAARAWGEEGGGGGRLLNVVNLFQ